jgi:hypothetical protein
MSKRYNLRLAIISFLGAVAVASLAGCESIGPKKLVDTHQGYNDAVQLAMSREMVLNIVRLRFGDSVQFLEVSQINAAFSVGVSAGGDVANIGGAGSAVGSISGSVSYSDSPNLTFAPRDDDQAHRDMLLPIHLYDAITFVNRGGAYDMSFLALITSGINDAPDIPGPNGELYAKRLEALRALVDSNLAWIGHGKRWVPKSAIPIAVEEITAFDHVWATNNNWQWVRAEPYIGEAGRGKALMAYEYHTPLLVLRDPENPEAQEHVRMLGLVPGKREYLIRSVNDEIALGDLGAPPAGIYLGFRSLKEIMGIVSEYVEVPPSLAERDAVPPGRYLRTSERTLPFKVRSSQEEPQNQQYKAMAHGYWFWIDESDHKSKAVLEALNYLFVSQSGASKPGDPILTLPLSPPGQ